MSLSHAPDSRSQEALRTAAGPRARLSTQYRYNQLLPPFAEDALLVSSLLAVARRAPPDAPGACLSHLLGAPCCVIHSLSPDNNRLFAGHGSSPQATLLPSRRGLNVS